MPAYKEYSWDYIAPGATVGVYIHGYPDNWALTYCGVVYALEGEAYYPLGQIDVTQTEVTRHVDGTLAHTVWVTNRAPFNPCATDLNVLYDSF